MNKFFCLLIAAFLAFPFLAAGTEEKTASEQASEAWDATKKTTKDVSRQVVKKTKETVAAIEHKIDNPDADARKIDVQLTDKGVQMPNALPPGKTAFMVENTGKQKHNFEITGEELDKSFWFSIAPGSKKTMQVELKAGRYDAACSIDEHDGKESKTLLTVK